MKRSELKHLVMEVLAEESGEYQDFFNATAEKFGFKPEDLENQSDEVKKKFFNYIETNWEGKNETLEPMSQAAGNPTKRLKAKKRDQILASEAKLLTLLRKLIREELKFVMFNEVPGGVSRKRTKKRITLSGSADKLL